MCSVDDVLAWYATAHAAHQLTVVEQQALREVDAFRATFMQHLPVFAAQDVGPIGVTNVLRSSKPTYADDRGGPGWADDQETWAATPPQAPHTDFGTQQRPLQAGSIIFAIMPCKFIVYHRSHHAMAKYRATRQRPARTLAPIVLTLAAGDILVFTSQLVHAGAGYGWLRWA